MKSAASPVATPAAPAHASGRAATATASAVPKTFASAVPKTYAQQQQEALLANLNLSIEPK